MTWTLQKIWFGDSNRISQGPVSKTDWEFRFLFMIRTKLYMVEREAEEAKY